MTASGHKLTTLRRIATRLVMPLARIGLAGRRVHLLTVRGRRSGQRRTTPVSLVIDRRGDRWLVAPYGAREWVKNVKNARAAGEVRLTRGRRTTHRIEEVDAAPADPVLREYVRTTPIPRRPSQLRAAVPTPRRMR